MQNINREVVEYQMECYSAAEQTLAAFGSQSRHVINKAFHEWPLSSQEHSQQRRNMIVPVLERTDAEMKLHVTLDTNRWSDGLRYYCGMIVSNNLCDHSGMDESLDEWLRNYREAIESDFEETRSLDRRLNGWSCI